MRRALALLALCLLLAPAALASAPPAPDAAPDSSPGIAPDSGSTAPADSEAVPAPGGDAELEALFEQIGDGDRPQQKKECPIDSPGHCTDERECMFYVIPFCPDPVCNNPGGGYCEGSCHCP